MMLLIATVLSGCCFAALMRARRAVWQLTIRTAWLWGIIAFATHVVAVFASVSGVQPTARTETLLHFMTAVMLLAPPVTVLGARRPGANAWPWFVTLPMLFVLLWPAANDALRTVAHRPIQPGIPAIAGIVVVLIMATGNYFGTRNTRAACCYVAAVLCHLSPAAGWIDDPSPAALCGSIMLCMTAWLTRYNFARIEGPTGSCLVVNANRMWLTFRDLFGIVWARRVSDRVNQFGGREAWTVKLTLDGFQSRESAISTNTSAPVSKAVHNARSEAVTDITTEQVKRPLEILCWVLKRFAEPEWFAAQLGRDFAGELNAAAGETTSTGD